MQVSMQIVVARPPNFEAILTAFPAAATPGTLFAYGDVLYNPSNTVIDGPLLLHEKVHSVRQKELGVERWWETYLTSPQFRLYEEAVAYRAQYRAASMELGVTRGQRRVYLRKLAHVLASRLYGNITTAERAKALLSDEQLDNPMPVRALLMKLGLTTV